MNQKLSVVIPTKNRKDDLFETLGSVFGQSVLPYEVIIIDQSNSKIDYASMCSFANAKNINFKVIYDPKIKGLTQARNIGLDNMKGDIVLFLDDDVILDKDYIEQISATYNYNSLDEVLGVGGVIRNSNNNHRVIGFEDIFNKGKLNHTRKGYSDINIDLSHTRYLYGCNMSFDIRKIADLKFDENYTGYSHGEDVDFCYQASKKGRLILNKKAKVLHKESQVGRVGPQRISNEIYFYWYFLCKNIGFRFTTLVCYLWLNLGLVSRPIMKFRFEMYGGILDGYRRILQSIITGKSQW